MWKNVLKFFSGIRFDYHDDDDDHVGLKRQSIAVVSNEGTNVNGKNVDPEPSKAEEKTNGQNILKIAENYGEDASQDVFLDTKDKNILVNGNSDIVTKSSNESSTKSLDTSIKMDKEIKEPSYSSKSDKGGKDNFQKVADSIKKANIGLDGSDVSPESKLRRLSANSKS